MLYVLCPLMCFTIGLPAWDSTSALEKKSLHSSPNWTLLLEQHRVYKAPVHALLISFFHSHLHLECNSDLSKTLTLNTPAAASCMASLDLLSKIFQCVLILPKWRQPPPTHWPTSWMKNKGSFTKAEERPQSINWGRCIQWLLRTVGCIARCLGGSRGIKADMSHAMKTKKGQFVGICGSLSPAFSTTMGITLETLQPQVAKTEVDDFAVLCPRLRWDVKGVVMSLHRDVISQHFSEALIAESICSSSTLMRPGHNGYE